MSRQPIPARMAAAHALVFASRRDVSASGLTHLSLFSGAGLGNLGYELAGFRLLLHAEKDHRRSALLSNNFPDACEITGDLEMTWPQVVRAWNDKCGATPPSLLSVTPPCQGLSSSNPGRGKIEDPSTSDSRNVLMLTAVPVITRLKPRVVVVENVRQILSRVVHSGESAGASRLIDLFKAELGQEYRVFQSVVQMADYGVPQDRRRAIIVAIRADEPIADALARSCRLPLPVRTHSANGGAESGKHAWISVEEWFSLLGYPTLDSSDKARASDPSDPMHSVPSYDKDRYSMIADIPPRSGQSAYRNNTCPSCGTGDVPRESATCHSCGELMRNRPYVVEADGTCRLIKGFDSSYRRMYPNRPAATVTTNTSHIGSDYKIHPWENRVLSLRECADLQTVPRFYDWSSVVATRHSYVARQVVGEAIPPLFTYLHGELLARLLAGEVDVSLLERDPHGVMG